MSRVTTSLVSLSWNGVLQCVAECCSVLQFVAVCCSVLQCVVEWCVVVCCSMLQCVVAVCCSALHVKGQYRVCDAELE